jgi:hypothetical protein
MHKLVPVTLLAAAALAAPSAAGAATAAGGTTDLSLTKAAGKALTAAGIKVSPVGTKASADGSIPFPVTGTKGGAKLSAIDHTGGLKLKRKGHSLTLTNFRIVVTKGVPASISAKVGKARVSVFRLSNQDTKVTADGLDTKISAVRVHLGPIGSAAIKATLGVKLPTGYRLATANVTLQSAATRVTLEPATAAALTGLGVSVAPTAPATAGSDGIQFPITNAKGKIALTAPITHSGGLVFTAGGKTLTVADFTIDPAAGLLYAETTPVGRLPLFKVDLSAITTATPGIQVVVTGAKLSLTAQAAGALNSTFGVTAFTENLAIGTASIVAKS